MLACSESRLGLSSALCRLRWRWAQGLLGKIMASDEVIGFRRVRALPGWAKWELLGLFPTPNEISFRTLTCLLAKAQEGNDAALAPCLPGRSFIQNATKKGHSHGGSLSCGRVVTVKTSFWFLLDEYPHICPDATCLSLNAVGSVSSCGVKASGRILLSCSFSPPWPFPLLAPLVGQAF